MFRLTKSLGIMIGLSALLLVGCPKKYKPANDGGGEENTEAACQDGVDNDGDTLVDCADDDCAGFDFCGETDCSNGIDDDGDGATDCVDTDCVGTLECQENNASTCQDGVDNDGDGDTDCDDSDCSAMVFCNIETECEDGVDNDNDGATDCDDTDCQPTTACGGFCYDVDFQAPGVWGMAITEANDDLDPADPCIQYDVVVQATNPGTNTQVCLYLDDLTGAPAGCADPTATNPMTFRVSLCTGQHMLYTRVESGMDTCDGLGNGLAQIQVNAFENPSCTVTLPAGLSEVQSSPTCWTQENMDVEISTNGASAQLWVAGGLVGTANESGGVVTFSQVALGADGAKQIYAVCYNAGTGTGSSNSPNYYVNKDTQGPTPQILSPATGAQFSAGDCPFSATVTGVEQGQDVCVHYTGQTPLPAACATSTGVGDQLTVTVPCVDGANLTVEANTTDSCGNAGQATIQVSADTGLPVVFIENPANGQVFNKAADTVDPATDAFETVITACIDQAYNPGDITLRVDGVVQTAYTPNVQAASCLGQPYRVTWAPAYSFSQNGSRLQTPHEVYVEVFDGFNTASDTSNFNNDTLPPILNANCASCQPLQAFYSSSMSTCTFPPMTVGARVEVTGLEVGELVTLTVESGGVPVGNSPYTGPSIFTGATFVDFATPCGPELITGQNDFTFTATDQAGNAATPAIKTVAFGDGSIVTPSSGALLSIGDDCDGGAGYGISATVQVDHASVANGTDVEVIASSASGGWSSPALGSSPWSKSCTGDPCTHTFCVPLPAGQEEQDDIELTLYIMSGAVPGGPQNITVDLTDPPPPTNPGMTVLNHRAAEIQLTWNSVEDGLTGTLVEWDVRCVEDGSLTTGNWATAMQFANEPTPAAAGVGQSMSIAEDITGKKIRAGHDYECGIRGLDQAGLWSSILLFPAIGQSDIGFQQWSNTIDGYTKLDYFFFYLPSIEGAGDLNGDGYDDLLAGYGLGASAGSPGNAAAIFWGSATGPSQSNRLDITCGSATFGGAMAGLGDFDGDVYSAGDPVAYPDFAVAAPEQDTVYIFRGHSGLGGTLDCSNADVTVVGPGGGAFGSTIVPIGDFDGDGLNDIAIGAPVYNSYAGGVWIIFGRPSSGMPVTINVNSGANADGAIFIDGLQSYSGLGLAAADLDADGYSDLVMTNLLAGTPAFGQIFTLLGYDAPKTPNTVTTLTAPGALNQVVDFAGPSEWWSGLGYRSLSTMDFDADGCLDVVVGAYGGRYGGGGANSGNVLVYRGQTVGATCTGNIGTTPLAAAYGAAAEDRLGFVVASGMNFTGPVVEPWRINGLLTSPSDVTLLGGAGQNAGPGYTSLLYGGFSGSVSSASADVTFSGVSGAVDFMWVNYVGDLDGDGYADIAVGDPGYAPNGRIVLYH